MKSQDIENGVHQGLTRARGDGQLPELSVLIFIDEPFHEGA